MELVDFPGRWSVGFWLGAEVNHWNAIMVADSRCHGDIINESGMGG